MGRGGWNRLEFVGWKGWRAEERKGKLGNYLLTVNFLFQFIKRLWMWMNEWAVGCVSGWRRDSEYVPLWIFPPLLSLLLYECFGWVCWKLRCLCPRQLMSGEYRAWRIWARNYLPTRNVCCGSLMQPCNCVTICNDDGWGGFSNATHATNQIQMRANYIFA